MLARPCIRPVVVLLAASTSFLILSVSAQTPETPDVVQIRVSLTQRGLWGQDYPLVIASIPAWAGIQENQIVVASDVIIGGTPYPTLEAARTQADALRVALTRSLPPLRPAFARGAEQGRQFAASKISASRYGGDESYRVIIGLGLHLLPLDLLISDVRGIVGREQVERRDIEGGAGERRPIVYNSHIYVGGALIYQSSSYAPAPDQVVRVVLSIQPALRAIAVEP
jgi:hypothetical protein